MEELFPLCKITPPGRITTEKEARIDSQMRREASQSGRAVTSTSLQSASQCTKGYNRHSTQLASQLPEEHS